MSNVAEEGGHGVVIVAFTGLPGVAGFNSRVGLVALELEQEDCLLVVPVDTPGECGAALRLVWQIEPHEL